MIRTRLHIFLKYKGIKPYALELALKIGNGLLSKKEGSFGVNILEKLYNYYPDLNIDWLVTGRGEMIINTELLEANEALGKQNKFTVKDSQEMITHELVELKAMLRMVLRVDSELLSSVRKEPNTKTINQISVGVADEISTVFAEISRRYG